MQSTPRRNAGEGAVVKTVLLWLTVYGLLVFAYLLGEHHEGGGPILLAGSVGLAAAIFLIGVAYEMGRYSVISSALGSLHESTAALMQATEELTTVPPALRLTGGGPLDGMETPHPADLLRQSPTRLVTYDDEEQPLGMYVQSDDDPEVLVWQQIEEDDDDDV